MEKCFQKERRKRKNKRNGKDILYSTRKKLIIKEQLVKKTEEFKDYKTKCKQDKKMEIKKLINEKIVGKKKKGDC